MLVIIFEQNFQFHLYVNYIYFSYFLKNFVFSYLFELLKVNHIYF